MLDFVDEAEFAGYVDSGIWELEEWLDMQRPRGLDLLMQHIAMSGDDSFED